MLKRQEIGFMRREADADIQFANECLEKAEMQAGRADMYAKYQKVFEAKACVFSYKNRGEPPAESQERMRKLYETVKESFTAVFSQVNVAAETIRKYEDADENGVAFVDANGKVICMITNFTEHTEYADQIYVHVLCPEDLSEELRDFLGANYTTLCDQLFIASKGYKIEASIGDEELAVMTAEAEAEE